MIEQKHWKAPPSRNPVTPQLTAGEPATTAGDTFPRRW